MLPSHPVGNCTLINPQLAGCGGLIPKMVNQTLENVIHSAPFYANAHRIAHEQTHLQGYERTHNNAYMELKDRLKAARAHAGLNQTEAARRAKVDQSTISNLERGRHRGTSHLVVIARALGVNARWLATGEGEMTGPEESAPSPSEDDYALIPQYSANGHCGDGYLNDHVEVKGGLAFKRDWLSRMGAKPENLRVIYAEGDSMEPYIMDGDVVLLDLSKTEPASNKVYAISRPDGGVSIKRLTQRFSGEWVISSDNPNKAKYQDEALGADSVAQVPIIGKVIWRGGAM